MTRIERCQMAIEKGFTYNPETGQIYNKFGKELKAKTSDNYLYFLVVKDNKSYNLKQHQFAWYWIHKECIKCIDHINGNRIDNRISNLRNVTQQENTFNSVSKGYDFDKKEKKWRARIKINNKSIYLGRYDTEEDARQAYLEAKEKYHTIIK